VSSGSVDRNTAGRAAVHPIEELEKVALHDDIAAACLAMMRNGATEQIAIATALRTYIVIRAKQRKMLARAAEILHPAEWAQIIAAGGKQ
jgi:uncharacterized protein